MARGSIVHGAEGEHFRDDAGFFPYNPLQDVTGIVGGRVCPANVVAGRGQDVERRAALDHEWMKAFAAVTLRRSVMLSRP